MMRNFLKQLRSNAAAIVNFAEWTTGIAVAAIGIAVWSPPAAAVFCGAVLLFDTYRSK